MRSILPQFMLMLLIMAACHKDEEDFVPVPPSEDPIAVAPPELSEEEEIDPPVRTDSAFYESAMFKDLPYRILMPGHMASGETFPLLVFLHGIGERGTDNEKQLSIGASYFLRDSIRESYPAFIVYPQCPLTSYWFDEDIMLRVKELIDTLQVRYAVDVDRLSIGGFSMGAYGTFEMASRFPKLFDAAVAISGDGDESKAGRMAKSRWRIFAGERDDVVPSFKSKKMAEALARAGASVSFTLYPEADHGSTWAFALSEPDLFRWLFRQNASAIRAPLVKN